GAIVAATEALLGRWAPNVGTGEPVRIDHDLTGVALAVASEAILGTSLGAVGGRFGQAVDNLNRLMGHHQGTGGAVEGRADRAQFRAAMAFIDGFVSLLVQQRRALGDDGSDDLLARLVLWRGEDGEALSDRDIRDQVFTMLMAGHETTAKALSWTLYLLDL